MRFAFCALLVVGLVASPLRADLTTVTKITVIGTGATATSATYVQGQNTRMEQLGTDGQRVPITIYNADVRAAYRIDEQAREYVQLGPQHPDAILSLAQWLARAPRVRQSGKTVDIYHEITDTGERKIFFGQTARHLIVHQRQVAEPGACVASSETKSDGWYVPDEASTSKTALIGFVTDFNGRCSDSIASHGDCQRPGFPVLLTENLLTTEVLELSRRPLDKSLFGVPSGFTKVDALPSEPHVGWWQTLDFDCAQLSRAAASWLE